MQRLFSVILLIWGSSWRGRELGIIASDSLCALFMCICVWKITVYRESTRKMACIPSRTEKIRPHWLIGLKQKTRTKSITVLIVYILAHSLYLKALYILGSKVHLASRSWFFQLAVSILKVQYSPSDVATGINSSLEIVFLNGFCTYLVPFSSNVEAIANVTSTVISLCMQCLQLSTPIWCK